MSRVRSDIPIYAFTRQESTRCRVCLYRGVYPVAYDVTDKDREVFYFSIFRQLLDLKLVQGGRLDHSHQGRAQRRGRRHQFDANPAGRPQMTEFRGTDRYIATEELMAAVNAASGAVAPAADQGRARHRQDAARGGDRPRAVETAVRVAHQVDHQGAAGAVRIRRRLAPARFAARRSAGQGHPQLHRQGRSLGSIRLRGAAGSADR